MRINLIHLWKQTQSNSDITTGDPSRIYPAGTNEKAIKFDCNTSQSSFVFATPPNVVFVNNIHDLELISFYEDLPEISLTPEEDEKRQEIVTEQQARDPRFYDGKQMLVTGILYDDELNTIYLEAKKVAYSFIVALSNKRFPEDSSLYHMNYFKTGVLVPLISRDNQTMLLERSALGLYSVNGGFLEGQGKENRLNFTDGNLVTKNATKEVIEEFAGIANLKEYADTTNLKKFTDASDSEEFADIDEQIWLRFEFTKPQITSLSFRKTATISIATAEFVAPTYANCNSEYLSHIASNNLAEDAHEHTENHKIIPLESQNRDELLKLLLTGDLKTPGAPLFTPVILCTAWLVNSGGSLPRKIPNSSSLAYPIGIFSSSVPRLLTDENTQKAQQEQYKLSCG